MTPPVALHQHLREGISYEPLETHSGDEVLDHISDERNTVEQQAAKRRRIEIIAAQYLQRGTTPVILCASLRGPFHNTWGNPWGKKKYKRENDIVSKVQHGKRGKEVGKRNVVPVAYGIKIQEDNQDIFIRQRVEEQLAGSSGEGTKHSGETQYFSAPVRLSGPGQNAGTDIAWLKRPSKASKTESPDDSASTACTIPSPSPVRHGNPGAHEEISLDSLQTNAISSQRSSPAGCSHKLPEMDRLSSTSVSVVLSSRPGRPSVQQLLTCNKDDSTVQDALQTNISSSNQRTQALSENPARYVQTIPHLQDALIDVTAGHTDALQNCSRCLSRTFSSGMDLERESPRERPLDLVTTEDVGFPFVVHFHGETPPATEGHVLTKEPIPPPSLDHGAAQKRKARLLSREDTQQSAEQRALVTSAPKAKKPRFKSSIYITSPAPNSSIGFMYQKIEKPNSKAMKANKLKAQPMTLPPPASITMSSIQDPKEPRLGAVPVSNMETKVNGEKHTERKKAARAEEIGTQAALEECIQVADSLRMQTPESEIYTLKKTSHEERRDSRTSGPSMLSTQAAIVLAQLEFQESSFLSAASETPEGLHGQQGTPPAGTRDAHGAITPFHAFNAELERQLAPESTSKEVPVSTQDLFDAASPFAFSTVRRKPPKPVRSNLRFPVHVSPSDYTMIEADNNRAKSPMALATRTPLTERNKKVDFKSSFDASQNGSQESPSQIVPKRTEAFPLQPGLPGTRQTVDLGASLEFTNQFLRNLGDVT